MDAAHITDDDDETWITSAEIRQQQLLRKDAGPESIVSENAAVDSLQHKASSESKNELKGGISCKLCYIVTPDNALMELHLMGPAHLRNVEKQDKKCRERTETQRTDSFSNETSEAIVTSNVEASLYSRDKDETGTTVVADRNIKDDKNCGETESGSKNSINDKDIKIDVIYAQSEKADEINNNSCEICNYFEGNIGLTPEHLCQNFYKAPELPAGWTEKVSRTSGCPYYVNNVTKEKQWEWPAQPVKIIDRLLDELPQDWVEKKAKSNGLSFYVNKVTSEWQWERPTKSPQSNVPEDFSVSTSKEAGEMPYNSVKTLTDNSEGKMLDNSVGTLDDNNTPMSKVGMMVSKLKVTKENAMILNEVEEVSVKTPVMTKTGEMISNLSNNSSTNLEGELKLDLMHWKQATEQWNNL